jgi:hypothetical protein
MILLIKGRELVLIGLKTMFGVKRQDNIGILGDSLDRTNCRGRFVDGDFECKCYTFIKT